MNNRKQAIIKMLICMAVFAFLAMLSSCALFLRFPTELQGRWYDRSLIYYTEYFEFSGNTMYYYSSYYGETYDYELTSLDKNAKSFTVDDDSTYTYDVTGSTLTLTADTGMVWHLEP